MAGNLTILYLVRLFILSKLKHHESIEKILFV